MHTTKYLVASHVAVTHSTKAGGARDMMFYYMCTLNSAVGVDRIKRAIPCSNKLTMLFPCILPSSYNQSSSSDSGILEESEISLSNSSS